MKKVKFFNGFSAIFSGEIKETFKTSKGIIHHEIINIKLEQKSDIDFDGANDVGSKTVLNSHIIEQVKTN
jgi:hypothetical protein